MRSAVTIRPEEQEKKVIIKVDPTYPNTKEIGDIKINLDTNREGGVEAPYNVYAASYMDPDLQFFDPISGEQLGVYIPPVQDQEVQKANSMGDLADMIRQLLEKSNLVGEEESLKNNANRTAIEEKKKEILDLHWTKRLRALETEIDSKVLQAVKDNLSAKENIGKSDLKALELINEKLKTEEIPILNGNKSREISSLPNLSDFKGK